VLEQLRFQDMDCVAVSVGKDMETSVLAALNLTDMRVRHILAKALSPAHRTVLRRLGVHQVIQPEADVAVLTAQRLSNPGMLDLLPLGGGVLVQLVEVRAWDGKTLAELNLTNKNKVMVVAVKKNGQADYAFVPDPKAPLGSGDSLVLIGSAEAVLSLEP
jgi:trk system potassium uptake protein TrkA